MGEIKISNLDPAILITGTDIIAGVKDGSTVKIKAEDILSLRMLDTSVWKETRAAVNSFKLSPTIAPSFEKLTDDGSGSQGVYTYVFSSDRDEEVYFLIHLDSNYKLGTDLYPTFHFIPGDTNVGNVKVNVEYFLVNGAIGDSIIVTKTLALDGVREHKDIDFGPIDGSAFTSIDNAFLVRLRRDVSVADNYIGNVFIIEFVLRHEIDQLGNSDRNIK